MSVRYVLKEGVAGIRRARLAAITSIFSLFVAVFIIGVLARVGFNAWEVAQTLRQQVEVEVFLQELDRQSTRELQERINGIELVESLSYISQDSAAAIFREEFGYGGETIAEIRFLPASFRLSMQTDAQVEEIESLVQEIGTWGGVDEVTFNMALLQMLESRIEMTALIGGALILLVVLASITLVFNTIRLTIYSKRDLIRAMKLVGATNAFIRRPFLVEGVLQGVIAGTAAGGAVYLIFSWLVPRYVPQLGVLQWPFGRWYYLVGSMIFAAVIMGWWGSRWAARRFIREPGSMF